MSKFSSKNSRSSASIGTAALPDIVFMLLFFFMVVTVFRDHQLLVKINLPQASQIQKLKHRSLVHQIYIGVPRKESQGNRPVIQINDAFVNVAEVGAAIPLLKGLVPEGQQGLVTTSLQVDKEVDMGIVSDVKIELRKAQQYKLNYAAIK